MEKRRIFLSPPHMDGCELQLVQEAFESNYIAPLGPMVEAFEREFAERVGIGHALALSSGTAAMHLAIRLLGIEPRDEVIASTLTFIGSVTPILFQGATPVFIDSDLVSWNMDPGLLEEELEICRKAGRLPKAVVPTDLYGQCADYERIFGVCERYEIPVVLDAAEALGAIYYGDSMLETEDGRRHAQTFSPADLSEGKVVLASQGDASPHKQGALTNVGYTSPARSCLQMHCIQMGRHAGAGAKAAVYSFNGNKIITTSGGGMLASDDGEFIKKARFLSKQARDPMAHYEHSQVGYNYRMSNILAAIGRGQLNVLDERVKAKRRIFEYYRNALDGIPGIEFMPEAPYGRSNRWLTVILIRPEEFGTDRETLRLALEAENIESRPVWKPMHMQPLFHVAGARTKSDWRKTDEEGYGFRGRGTRYHARVVGGRVSEDLFGRGLCLPSGTQMTIEDLDRVIAVIRKCGGEERNGRLHAKYTQS